MHIKPLLYNTNEVSVMKSILSAVVTVAILIVLKWAAFLLLPMRYASIVVPVLRTGTVVFIIAYLLWFFWPYIKRGINYLVQHRGD